METQERKIVIPCLDSYEFVLTEDIVRLEGCHNYARIHMAAGVVLNSTATIGVYKKVLDSAQFFCCHKSHIINIHHIVRYNKEGHVVLSNGESVPVSRRRKEMFIQEIVNTRNISAVLLENKPIK